MSLLRRVRWLFMLFSVLMAAIAPVEATYDHAPDGLQAWVMVASFLAFGVWAVAYYHRDGRGPVLDLLPYALVIVATVAAGDFELVLGRWSFLLFLHALYRPSRRRTILLGTGHTLAIIAGATLAGVPAEDPIAGLVGVVIVYVMVYLIQGIAASMIRHERLSSRNATLTRTTAALLAARGSDDIGRIVAEGTRQLVDGEAQANVWRASGHDLALVATAGSPPRPPDRLALGELPDHVRESYLAGDVLVVAGEELEQLKEHIGYDAPWTAMMTVPVTTMEGSRGSISIASTEPLDDDLPEVLRRFAHEVSLAQQLAEREQMLDGVLTNSADLILVVDAHGTIGYVSPAMTAWTGRPPTHYQGETVGDLLQLPTASRPFDATDLRPGEVTLARFVADGRPLQRPDDGPTPDRDVPAPRDHREVEVTTNLLDDGDRVLNVRDVSERRRLEAELTYRAFHDHVTGLPNRARFLDRLEQAAEAPTGDGTAVALLDLDDFKWINDTLGHSAGDDCLVEFARRLELATRRGDLVARIGGDEFAILLQDLEDHEHPARIIERLLDELRVPMTVEGHELQVSASVGIAMVEEAEVDDVLRNADAAMYAAKELGKNRQASFQVGMREERRRDQQLRAELETAIAEGQFIVHYQPILALANEEEIGVEALVRWEHPTLGTLAPDRFIGTAERTGQIIPLGRWVLFEACREVATWPERPDVAPPSLSVNLSAVQIHHPQLVDDVRAALADSGLQPAQLVLEITETALIDDITDAREVLLSLRELGVRIAIDDFGAGYSSIGYLHHLPVDILKIDRGFIAAIDDGDERAGIAEGLVRLATTMQLNTVAEGVEQADQLTALIGWGCTYAQGWLWAPAQPADEARRRLAAPETAETDPDCGHR